MSTSEKDITDKGKVKDASREGRLSFRNFAEHQLRNEFKEESLKKCDLQIRAFAECGKQEGLMVIFRCREFQKDVTDCMTIYNSDEQFELYKQKHAPDLQK
mmetsp:Transcript_123914/g.185234  ORF Transcript_123914/g.185234 Transcript_123914/m.185234 type:complete len:101 (+) Transcript_123914:186-488(+)|eukprot:CAMPEP_0117039462 /NCGR_PEP_ID=MMETSP0472-20121206/27693_1 /TAXON_ID=693140 ORGANISM="Tiarina fusus, Strain LIS" /NCGR_SAMPLE_ID=MMETSP0472 /ASSEMBLY_ACC=CAM_ASM_000603 /LENGTH=100 /DNA_ID=CAMNT_0004749957 /DNA_START=186 /DNA_END=488 /DNA_ORIENTATION=+